MMEVRDLEGHAGRHVCVLPHYVRWRTVLYSTVLLQYVHTVLQYVLLSWGSLLQYKYSTCSTGILCRVLLVV